LSTITLATKQQTPKAKTGSNIHSLERNFRNGEFLQPPTLTPTASFQLLSATLAFAILQSTLAHPTAPPHFDASPLGQLANVLPAEELKQLKMKHLTSDPGFRAAVVYFKSPEWAELIADVRNTPEWIRYKAFLKEVGLDLDYLIQHVDHCVNATDTHDFKVEGVKPSLASFLQDVKMNLGIPIMKGLHEYVEKVGKTDDYKKVVEEMLSDKSKELLEKALAQPALIKMMDQLREMDANLGYVIQMLYTFAGWQPLTNTRKA
jgi:hypothetical protein